jgi:hypothetical protein
MLLLDVNLLIALLDGWASAPCRGAGVFPRRPGARLDDVPDH